MVSSFRVSELQVLLGFAGRNKSGRKHELLLRALHLLKSGCSPAVQIKIKELYQRRYPRTTESLPDFSSLKSSVFAASFVDPDLSLTTGISHGSSIGTHASVYLHETKPRMDMQQPAPPIPPVHPDVQMKSLPFYDVLDVLIKPSSLG